MKRLIEHWCLYYVWVLRYFEQKKRKGAKEIAFNLLMVPILLYVMLYAVVPVLSISDVDRSFMRDNKILLVIGFLILVAAVSGVVYNNRHLRNKLAELNLIEDWKNCPYYNKGRSIVRFHFFFSVVSVPLSIGLCIFASKLM